MRAADRVLTNEIAEAVLEAAEPIPVDRYQSLPWTGRGVLLDGADAQGGAIVLDLVEGSSAPPEAGERGVSREERERRNRHRGGVLWLSGRAGAGKATLAFALERALFDGGMQAMVLDGDSVPALYAEGVSSGQSGSPAIRDLAAAARILAQAGQIAIVSLSAPTRADRALARAIAGEGFVEIHLHADPALCQTRDPDGGANRPATDESSDFEPPLAPELEIDTGTLDIAQSVDRLIAFVDSRLHDPRIDLKLVEPEWSV
jgi:bifunctional enzyme CysN/CysC